MTLMPWQTGTTDPNEVRALMQRMGLKKLTACVLAARGKGDEAQARAFLQDEVSVSSPYALRDMDKAVARIRAAIEQEEKIAVFGDYDVDGVTATALMYQCLLGCGADVVCALPAREATGYGLAADVVDNMKAYGVSLIVTVDNGISAFDEIAYAGEQGIDVVVCDHHLPPEQLPPAVAVVDPLRKDDESPFKHLAGVGVALKLAAALEDTSVEEALDFYGPFAAVGTVSDIMPLVGENRVVVKRGLAAVETCDSMGLRALCEAAGLDTGAILAKDVAFSLAPRLNAAGRMGSAETALQLLITEDMEEAHTLAGELAALNKERQTTEQDITGLVAQEIEQDPALLDRPIIVVSGQNLHAGVIGIACSRLVERYKRPAIVISVEGETARGSGRSVRDFSLHEAIKSGADLLEKFGGHEMAAGFTLDSKNIDAFKQRLFDFCAAREEDIRVPALAVDALIEPADATMEAVKELAILEPYGSGNDEPVFGVVGAEFVSAVLVAERHSRITLRSGGKCLSGILFSKTPDSLPFKNGDSIDAAFQLSVYTNERGSMVSVKFRDVRKAGVGKESLLSRDAYRQLLAGRPLRDEHKSLLGLTRQDVATVWRGLQTAPVDRDDEPRLLQRFSAIPLGRVMAALDVLLDVGLVERSVQRGARVYTAVKSETKRDLTASPIYRALCGE